MIFDTNNMMADTHNAGAGWFLILIIHGLIHTRQGPANFWSWLYMGWQTQCRCWLIFDPDFAWADTHNAGATKCSKWPLVKNYFIINVNMTYMARSSIQIFVLEVNINNAPFRLLPSQDIYLVLISLSRWNLNIFMEKRTGLVQG